VRDGEPFFTGFFLVQERDCSSPFSGNYIALRLLKNTIKHTFQNAGHQSSNRIKLLKVIMKDLGVKKLSVKE